MERPPRRDRRLHHGVGSGPCGRRIHGRQVHLHSLRQQGRARIEGGTKAIKNTGKEIEMRKESWPRRSQTSSATSAPARRCTTSPKSDEDIILRAADLVSLARTGVEVDYRGR